MSAFVLGASVPAAWLFDDENDPRADIVALAHIENDATLATLDAALARASVAEGLVLIEPMDRSL